MECEELLDQLEINDELTELDDSSWILELESALEDEGCLVDQRKLRQICKLKTLPDSLRPQVWKISLSASQSQRKAWNSKGGDSQSSSSHDGTWSDIYDLSEQSIIRQDCQHLVEKLGNENEEKLSVLCDLESIVTRFCKQTSLKYDSNNGWMSILEPLVALRLSKQDLYMCFYQIVNKFVPRSCLRNSSSSGYFGSAAYHLMRLLLQYHDPEICSFLETKKIAPQWYCEKWFNSLFSEPCDLQVTQNIWDIYLQLCDPFLIFYLALVLVVNLRDQILASKTESREYIIESISCAPCALHSDDVEDFCQLAQFYSTKTPPSLYATFKHSLFGIPSRGGSQTALSGYGKETIGGQSTPGSPSGASTPSTTPKKISGPSTPDSSISLSTSFSGGLLSEDLVVSDTLSQTLCLPVPPSELLLSEAQRLTLPYKTNVRYFVVDCRPAEQYNSGHLRTAFHLDASLMMHEPQAYSIAVQGLFAAQKQLIEMGAAGEHICFMGSGREEEDQYVNMVIASFLQKQVNYISQVKGGYAALHDLISEESNLEEHLSDHNNQLCIVCVSNGINNPNSHRSRKTDGYNDDENASQQNSSSFLSKWKGHSSILGKLKNMDWKKDIEGLMKPGATGNGNSIVANGSAAAPAPDRHVSSRDKLGRRYRASDSLFTSMSVDDDDFLGDEGDIGDVDLQEEVCVDTWKAKPDVLSHYTCEQMKSNRGLCPNCHLIITKTHLFVLKELSHKKNYAHIIARRPLVSIVKITSKKSHPELITFKYGYCPSDYIDSNGISVSKEFQITGQDTLFIPRASDAIKLVKMQVMNLLEDIENNKNS